MRYPVTTCIRLHQLLGLGRREGPGIALSVQQSSPRCKASRTSFHEPMHHQAVVISAQNLNYLDLLAFTAAIPLALKFFGERFGSRR